MHHDESKSIDVRCPSCSATYKIAVAGRGLRLVCGPSEPGCGASLDAAVDDALDALVRSTVERMAGNSTPDPEEIPRLARSVSEEVGAPCVVAYSPFSIETVALGMGIHERTVPRRVLVAYAVPIERRVTRWERQYEAVFGRRRPGAKP